MMNQTNKLIDIRDAFFDEVYRLAQIDKDLIFLTDDMDAFALKQFKKNLPKQFINIGVAEQNMIDLAAGLATSGKKVFALGICSYVTMRDFEQIKFSVCSMNLPVTIIGIGTGFSFGFDGPTHHGTQDIALMRILPEMKIFNPIDQTSAKYAAQLAFFSNSPTYIRIDKGSFPIIYTSKSEVKSGFKIIKPLKKNNLITTGFMTQVTKNILEEDPVMDKNYGLIDLFLIKPFPKQLLNLLKTSKELISIEENSLVGGLGTIINELVITNDLKIKIHNLAVQDKQFLKYGSREYLLSLNNLDAKSLKKTIINLAKNE